ncbi:MAG: hypothetical protein Q9166_002314 [cf. Caloplaca sp. 2 TL-2023]
MSTPVEDQPASHSCVKCGQGAANVCGACHKSPDGETGNLKSTWYCGAQCQKDDWNNHKALCKASVSKKMLYRAASIAQELFYIYREIAFDKLILKVERKEGEMILYEGMYKDLVFIPFPASLFKDDKEKKAMLTYLACGDAWGYMDVLLKTMLNGISSKLSDITLKLKRKHPLKLRMINPRNEEDLNDYRHEVMKVELKDGSTFIVDLAGAQYGYLVPVMPYDAYLELVAEDKSNVTERPFGNQRLLLSQLAASGTQIPLGSPYAWAGVIRKANERLYQSFNDALAQYGKATKPLPDILRLKEESYLEYKSLLMLAVRVGVGVYKEEQDERFAQFMSQHKDEIFQQTRQEMSSRTKQGSDGKAKEQAMDKGKERTFEEDVAELLQSAHAKGYPVLDMGNLRL